MLVRATRAVVSSVVPRLPVAVAARGLAGPGAPPAVNEPVVPANRALTVMDESLVASVTAKKKKGTLSARLRSRRGNPMPFYQKYRIGPSRPVNVRSLKEGAVLTGMLEHSTKRKVTIYKIGPVTNVTEPRVTGRHWSIKFDHQDSWGSITMGWAAGTDVMRGVGRKLVFSSLPEAIGFCERVGWDDYIVQKPRKAWTDDVYNLYDHKHLSRRMETRIETQGPRRVRKHWAHAGAGSSNWQNRRRSAYGEEEWKPTY